SGFTFTVTALDAFGNVATGYSGTVHFTSTDAAAGLPADTALAAGVGSFTAVLSRAGAQALSAGDTAAAVTGTAGVQISPLAATHFAVSAPAAAAAGSGFRF